MHTIHLDDSHITVKFHGSPSLSQLELAIVEVIKHPAYEVLNDIWVFDHHTPLINLSGFNHIEAIIKLLYPPNATRTKTAIVADPGLGHSIAQLWKEHTQGRLPYETEIFSALEPAKSWVTN